MAPELLFGCASLGSVFRDAAATAEVLSAVAQSGITRLDTAARYGGAPHRSETLLGEANAAAQGFTIDTKILLGSTDGGPTLNADAIEASLTKSLEVLKVPKVNILYVHGPDHVTPIEQQAAAFDAQHRKGRFAHLGVSNMSPRMLQDWFAVAEARGFVKPAYYQGQYNLLCRGHEASLLPLLREHGMHYVAFSPLGHGVLAGRSGAQLPPPFNVYGKASVVDAQQRLRNVAAAAGLSMEEAALRWLTHHSELGAGDGIILGASRAGQVTATTAAIARGPLPSSVAEKLKELWVSVEKDVSSITSFE